MAAEEQEKDQLEEGREDNKTAALGDSWRTKIKSGSDEYAL